MENCSKQRPSLCLLDASIYIFRYYFSLPDNWFAPQSGYPTAAVYGYTHFLLGFLTEQRPRQMAACFDESLGSCFRNQLYADYKCSRALPDEALAFQLRACREVTELLGIATYASETYEADDLIGSLLMQAQRQSDAGVAILTRDKDLGQLLLREQDCLWDYVNPQKQQRLYRQQLCDKFGVWPEQLVDYLALVGDAADDIPGVPGVGVKTARTLLQWGGTLENIFARFDDIADLPIRGARSLADKLLAHAEQIALSRSLAQIITDVDWQAEGYAQGSADPEAPIIQPPQREAFEDFCRRMGFGSGFLNKLEALPPLEHIS